MSFRTAEYKFNSNWIEAPKLVWFDYTPCVRPALIIRYLICSTHMIQLFSLLPIYMVDLLLSKFWTASALIKHVALSMSTIPYHFACCVLLFGFMYVACHCISMYQIYMFEVLLKHPIKALPRRVLGAITCILDGLTAKQ